MAKAILFILALFGCQAPEQPPPDAANEPTTIITWNLKQFRLTTVQSVAAFLRDQDPDLLLLQEVTEGQALDLAGILNMEAMLFSHGKATLCRPGMCTSQGSYGLEHHRWLRSYGLVTWRGITVANVHLSTHPDVQNLNTIELKAALAGIPSLIAGDFNGPPGALSVWSDISDQTPTYPAPEPKARIDYILSNKAVEHKRPLSWTLVSNLSDHLPVVVEVVL